MRRLLSTIRRWLAAAMLAVCALLPSPALAAVHVIIVTATYPQQDDVTPAVGSVTFQLSTTLRDATTNQSFAPIQAQFPLDASGHFSAAMIATDDPELSPTGGTYLVTERIN